MILLCQLCCKEPVPDEFGFGPPTEQDQYGDWWVYCRDCDSWTSHPDIPIQVAAIAEKEKA